LYLIAFLGSFLAMQLYGMANVMAAEQGDPVTSVFDMRANGIDYRIFVAAPKTAENDKHMPVIYMIDGNSTFPMAVDVVKKRPQLRALIVGIG
ncbi:alpha/beta hydrolase, partial [Ochrobactrum sp. MR31]|nr:alpha/beta hydrolase [Ochrobactrum sp. MR31]